MNVKMRDRRARSRSVHRTSMLEEYARAVDLVKDMSDLAAQPVQKLKLCAAEFGARDNVIIGNDEHVTLSLRANTRQDREAIPLEQDFVMPAATRWKPENTAEDAVSLPVSHNRQPRQTEAGIAVLGGAVECRRRRPSARP